MGSDRGDDIVCKWTGKRCHMWQMDYDRTSSKLLSGACIWSLQIWWSLLNIDESLSRAICLRWIFQWNVSSFEKQTSLHQFAVGFCEVFCRLSSTFKVTLGNHWCVWWKETNAKLRFTWEFNLFNIYIHFNIRIPISFHTKHTKKGAMFWATIDYHIAGKIA